MQLLERYISGRGGGQLYVREWLPEAGGKPVKAAVCLLHGMGEHGERYMHAAERFTDEGYAVIAPDHFGHGKSHGKRGHMLSIEAAIGDAALVIDNAAERHPGLPVLLYGHSMGGNIALNCALRLGPQIDGLILSSPWLRLAFRPTAAKVMLGRAVAAVIPGLTQSTGLKPDQLYRMGTQQGAFLDNDPLYHNKITVRTFLEIQKSGEWALAHAERLPYPLLLLHGTADRVTDYETSAELARKLGERCDWRPVEGGYHELHNDLDGASTLREMIDWMDAKVNEKQ